MKALAAMLIPDSGSGWDPSFPSSMLSYTAVCPALVTLLAFQEHCLLVEEACRDCQKRAIRFAKESGERDADA